MYRTAPPGMPPPEDPRYVAPGEGLRGILVGRATADDVLRVLGPDAAVHRYADGDPFTISYDHDANEAYLPDRPAQAERPCGFQFEFGLLKAIEIGVYQTGLYTAGGLRIGSAAADVVRELGTDRETLKQDGGETLRYAALGIVFDVSDEGLVTGFTVFRARR